MRTFQVAIFITMHCYKTLFFLNVNNSLCPISVKGFFMRYEQYRSCKS